MNAQEMLQQLGLGKNERDVYIALMSHGEGSVSEIAKVCATHRVNIYDALEQLKAKGLVSVFLRDKTKIYKTNDPSALISYIRSKEQLARDLLPQLQRSYDAHLSSAQTFYGPTGIKHIINDMLDTKQPIVAFGIPKELPELLGKNYLNTFHRTRIKKKISIDHIYNENAQERIAFLNKIKYSRARYLDKEYSVPTATLVYGNKVAFWIFSKEIFCLLVQSPEMAETYRKYFQYLWSQAH